MFGIEVIEKIKIYSILNYFHWSLLIIRRLLVLNIFTNFLWHLKSTT